jgi:hypothetical protein
MEVNNNACFLNKRVALESIASKLGSYKKLTTLWAKDVIAKETTNRTMAYAYPQTHVQ